MNVFEFEGKTEKEAIETAASELGLEKDQFDVEILEIQKNSIFKKGFTKIRVHTDSSLGHETNTNSQRPSEIKAFVSDPLPKNDFEKEMISFVEGIITKMGYEIKIEVMTREDSKLSFRLISPNSSILIGRKGKNIDALQLLANVYAGKIGHEEIKIILDSENYRIRREETLVRLAYTTADRVRINKGTILLEPMNPYERRLIHTTLNDIGDVDTKSEGEGLYKQVRVFYKGR